MSPRDIIILPDRRLKTVSEPVHKVTAEVRGILDDMMETMYKAPGIGLAAIQVGIPLRLVVMDVSRDDTAKQPLYLVNPEIVWRSDEVSAHEEGCLSIPDVYETIERPAEVKVRFLDRDGAPQELHCADILATCVQHEIDHLNGVLLIDHLTRLKRDRINRKFIKAARREGV